MDAKFELEDLHEMARVIRMSLEPGLLRGTDGKYVSAGTCLHASILLCFSINKFTQSTADVRGGDGDQDGGALGSDARWHGHYWVDVEASSGHRFVIDITADQFGYSAIYAEPLTESLKRYRPGRQDFVDEAAVSLAMSFGDAEMVKLSATRLRKTEPVCHSKA